MKLQHIGLFLMFAATLFAGSIEGRVEAKPAEAGGSAASTGAYGSRRLKFLERIDYSQVRDFIVYIDHVPAAENYVRSHPVIEQRDGEFVPHILPVVVGTEVEFSNLDDIYHNVFSMSDACGFDLGLYKRGDGKRTVKFELTGRVDIFCSIHSRMSCTVLVLPNGWFSQTDSHGRFEIRDVPPGRYRVKAWHERLPAKSIEVEVGESAPAVADFILGPGR